MRERDFFRMFEAERDRFASHFPWVASVQLRVEDSWCSDGGKCPWREVAATEFCDGWIEIVFVRRALALPKHNLVALVRHELGHASDRRVDSVGREQRADDIAEGVTGQKIRYDGRDLQTIRKTGAYPRPSHLRR